MARHPERSARQLYLKWYDSAEGGRTPQQDSFSRADTYDDFYNTVGGGDELERLLKERLETDPGFKEVT